MLTCDIINRLLLGYQLRWRRRLPCNRADLVWTASGVEDDREGVVREWGEGGLAGDTIDLGEYLRR